ncbi:MAG: lipoprotein [Litorivicinaceae bacterium]|nr:lipoprotein [Litorivicinaceae bacterium]MDP5328737.1 lipoprotein [Litorivicinaceae bacterium]MDP5330351.1 lipoprotein [Litorivicinaceae bacterium]MDP5340190.1 lipoprotein [Litorivicinaceae bacterium]MDP5342819.1 lipoprotein [Litorivicinaceae bacterium]
MKIFVLMLTLIGSALLIGCGQTGPLYLPDQPAATSEGR